MKHTRINENIHRMVIPYKDIFTTVYTVQYDRGAVLFDTATYESDVTDYIVPMLESLGIDENTLKYIFISHNHGDHAGGTPYLLERYPDACLLTRSPNLYEKYTGFNVKLLEDGEEFDGTFRAIAIPGHSMDSAGLYDTRTKTMITGDSLQLYGLFGSQDWGSNIPFPAEHLEAIEKLRKMDIENIYSAHDFHPYGYAFVGKKAVSDALSASETPIKNIAELILKNPAASDAEIREIYNSSAKIPPVREGVFRKMREELEAGILKLN